MDGLTELREALGSLGVEVGPDDPQGSDLVVGDVAVEVKRRALVTDDVARRLVREPPERPGRLLVVVADRVTGSARKLLSDAGVGYLDLRGRLSLRSGSTVILADVAPLVGRPVRARALGGRAGVEVALALLMEPTMRPSVRELARQTGRSPSTVSEVCAALRRDGLIDQRHAVADAELFWQVAADWSAERVLLLTAPPPGDRERITAPLRLGLDDPERSVGWALSDTVAAAAYGAPVAARVDGPLDFYVPDRTTLHRARALLGVAPAVTEARCTVRVAPAPAVCARRVDLAESVSEWPLVHPVVVALDLAQDAGRGREILDAWTPDGRWARVW